MVSQKTVSHKNLCTTIKREITRWSIMKNDLIGQWVIRYFTSHPQWRDLLLGIFKNIWSELSGLIYWILYPIFDNRIIWIGYPVYIQDTESESWSRYLQNQISIFYNYFILFFFNKYIFYKKHFVSIVEIY